MIVSEYSTGTVSIAANGTVVTGSGGPLWLSNVSPRDELTVDGYGPVRVRGVTDDNHLQIFKWPYGAVVAANYTITRDGVTRFNGASNSAAVNKMISDIMSAAYLVPVPPGAAGPDPSSGVENSYGVDPSTARWFQRLAGVWGASDPPSDNGAMFSPSGRISLSSTSPISSGDLLGQPTVWALIGEHDLTSIWNGTVFVTRRVAAAKPIILDATAHLAYAQHDVFEYWDGAAVQYGFGPAWTVGGGSFALRGIGAGSTELDFTRRGRATNKYPITLRNNSVNTPAPIPAGRANIRGTVGISPVAGLTSDGFGFRLVSNWHNVVRRRITIKEPGTAWAGSGVTTPAVLRQFNNGATNTVIDLVQCGDSHFGQMSAFLSGAHAATLGAAVHTGIGFGSTTVSVATSLDNITLPTNSSGQSMTFRSFYNDAMPQGRYGIYPLEYSGGDATVSFYSFGLSGLDGWIEN